MLRLPNKRPAMTIESLTELFHFQVSALVLLNYDAQKSARLLSLGRFCINLIQHATCPIFATVCCVGCFQWPLTKDTVVVRIAQRSFAIALPGLLYGLQFPNTYNGDIDNILVGILGHFSHYVDLNADGQGYPADDCEPQLWKKVRARVEPLVHEILVRLGQWPGSSRYCLPNQNSCFLRASRMSTVTKMIVESIQARTLTNAHITIKGTNPPNAGQDRAYASVRAFSSLIDAVELAWVVSCGLQHMLMNIFNVDPFQRASAQDTGSFQFWVLNEEGMKVFLIKLAPPEAHHEKEKREEPDASASAKGKGKRIMP